MFRRLRGIIAAVVSIVVIVVVLVVVDPFSSSGGGASNGGSPNGGASNGPTHTVRGLIGSENADFFADPRVQHVFAQHGLNVEVDSAGSAQIAGNPRALDGYDFGLVSGLPTAQVIQQQRNISVVYTPFSSPLVIATYAPIRDLLVQAHIARQSPEGYWIFDLSAYLKLFDRGTKWSDLPGSAATYPSSNRIVVTTTLLKDSNSAEMFAAAVSNVLNNGTTVANQAAQNQVDPELASVFGAIGDTYDTTGRLFNQYESPQGMSLTPMAWVYESQFVQHLMANDGTIGSNELIMYPSTTVLSQRVVVPITPPGGQVGQLMQNDAQLQQLAAQDGFREFNGTAFSQVAQSLHTSVNVPLEGVNVVPPPSYPVLESIVNYVEAQTGGGTPSAATAFVRGAADGSERGAAARRARRRTS